MHTLREAPHNTDDDGSNLRYARGVGSRVTRGRSCRSRIRIPVYRGLGPGSVPHRGPLPTKQPKPAPARPLRRWSPMSSGGSRGGPLETVGSSPRWRSSPAVGQRHRFARSSRDDGRTGDRSQTGHRSQRRCGAQEVFAPCSRDPWADAGTRRTSIARRYRQASTRSADGAAKSRRAMPASMAGSAAMPSGTRATRSSFGRAAASRQSERAYFDRHGPGHSVTARPRSAAKERHVTRFRSSISSGSSVNLVGSSPWRRQIGDPSRHRSRLERQLGLLPFPGVDEFGRATSETLEERESVLHRLVGDVR